MAKTKPTILLRFATYAWMRGQQPVTVETHSVWWRSSNNGQLDRPVRLALSELFIMVLRGEPGDANLCEGCPICRKMLITNDEFMQGSDLLAQVRSIFDLLQLPLLVGLCKANHAQGSIL